jgi:aldehyde:ferredoxin oxidoreductase
MNMSNRANGRTGMGAVMGSKNLKAVAVRGKNKPALADRRKLIDLSKWGAGNIENSDVYGLGVLGTSEVTLPQNKAGGLPTRNWDSGYFENARAIDGTTMANTILKDRDTCYACAIRCKRVVEIQDGPYKVDPFYGGPEYETLATFGSYCGIDDLAAIAYANQLCNMYGMDTISCGATIAWAFNCYEEGLITREDTGDLELYYGDAAEMVKLTEMIARRDGFGDILAEGSERAAEIIGKGTEALVVTSKKQELPAHMPQVKRSLGLIYAVNPFGADHQSSEHDPNYEKRSDRMDELGLKNPQGVRELNKEKVRFALRTQLAYSTLDTFNICQFVFGAAWQLYAMSQLTEAIEAVVGWRLSVDDLLTIGERRLNMLRAFNAREGIGREADKLPRKLHQALTGGTSDGLSVSEEEIESAKTMYYTQAGWDPESGYPTIDKLQELGLAWVADMLYEGI